MSVRRPVAFSLAGGLACLSLAACAPKVTPSGGRVVLDAAEEPSSSGGAGRGDELLITPADDRTVGERQAREAAQQLGLVEDPVLVGWVDAVGQRLAQHAPGDFRYHFQIVDQETPNAFALPGGWVFVTRGLLLLVNSEDELANVLGHEIVHVAERHAAREQAVSRAPQLRLPSVMSGVDLAGDQLGGSREAWLARYQRAEESEADRVGQQIAARSGWSPQGMSAFLRSLENAQRLQLGTPGQPFFLDSHPASPERLTAAATQGALLERSPQPGIADSREELLARLEGLVVGQDPLEGLLDGSLFVHPVLDFSLRFPEGWTTVNTHAAVGAVSPARDAEVILEGQGPGSDPRAAADAFFAKPPSGAKISRRGGEALVLAGGPAWREQAELRQGSAVAALDVVWLVHEGQVYRITALRPALMGKFGKELALEVARSFRPATPQEKQGITVTRLRSARARDGESLESFSARTGNTWKPTELAVMNGFLENQPLVEGQLLKIAVEEPWQPPAKETPEPAPAGGNPG